MALDSMLGTNAVLAILNNVEDPKCMFKEIKKSVLLKDPTDPQLNINQSNHRYCRLRNVVYSIYGQTSHWNNLALFRETASDINLDGHL